VFVPRDLLDEAIRSGERSLEDSDDDDDDEDVQ